MSRLSPKGAARRSTAQPLSVRGRPASRLRHGADRRGGRRPLLHRDGAEHHALVRDAPFVQNAESAVCDRRGTVVQRDHVRITTGTLRQHGMRRGFRFSVGMDPFDRRFPLQASRIARGPDLKIGTSIRRQRNAAPQRQQARSYAMIIKLLERRPCVPAVHRTGQVGCCGNSRCRCT